MRYLIVLMLAACGTISAPEGSGKFFTIEHRMNRFQDAMTGAKEHCAAMGLEARHLGTDRGALVERLSRFECVPK